MSRVKVPRKLLSNALSRLGKVIQSRCTKDILQCIRVSAEDGLLALEGTDLEVSLKVNILAEGEMKPALVKLADLASRVNAGKSPECELWVEDQPNSDPKAPPEEVFCLSGGRITHRLVTFPLPDYPPIPAKPKGIKFTFDAQRFNDRLGIMLKAVARENTRYAINGVLLEAEKKTINLVATDGRREVWTEVGRAEKDAAAMAILPAKSCEVLRKLIEKNETAPLRVHIEYSTPKQSEEDKKAHKPPPQPEPQTVYFVGPDYLMATAVVEGHFPRWRDVIPVSANRFMFCVADMVALVREVSLATTEYNKGVILRIADGELQVSARAYDVGESSGTMSCTHIGGTDKLVWTGFNPGFLIEALSTLQTDFGIIDLPQNRPGNSSNCEVSHFAARFHDQDSAVNWVVMPVNTGVPANHETLGSNHPDLQKKQPTAPAAA